MDGNYPPQMTYPGPFYSMAPPTMLPPEMFTSPSQQFPAMSTEGLQPAYPSELDESSRAVAVAPSQQKPRRRPPQGADYVKHRRTRSGCYTCRQRRVKCDETRPICNRCSKGKRDCHYPDATTSAASAARIGAKTRGSPSTSHSSPSADDDDADAFLHSAPNDQESESSLHDDRDGGEHDSRRFSSASMKQSSSLQLSPSSTRRASMQQDILLPGLSRAPASKSSIKHANLKDHRRRKMPNDVEFYLNFHRKNLSYHHYAQKCDGGDFLKTTFIDIAMSDECGALLHGIVAFSAYHYAIQRGDGRLSPFLFHYNKSISLLQQSLQTQRHGVATLLTILQLATIEEFLGDWVTLLGHQRAAHRILTDLFTPATIMQDETRRKILAWYARLDIFAGMLSGGDTVLGREWAAAAADFYTQQAKDRPDDLNTQFEENFATSRLLAADMGALFAARQLQAISAEQFESDAARLSAQFAAFSTRIETAFTSSDCFVKDFSQVPQPSQDDLSDFRDPEFLYRDNLFTMNFILGDFWAIDLMFRRQLAEARGLPPGPELTELALRKCKMFEAVQYCGQGPPGAVLGFQASLGILSLCVPNDPKHTAWCRRKYAVMEQHGYNYPSTLRQRMSDLWGEDVTRWWLPNDEGYKPIIAALREFVTFRNCFPRDAWGAKLRDMSGIFRNLDMKEDRHNPSLGSISALDSEHLEHVEEMGGTWDSSPENWVSRVDGPCQH